MVKMTGLFSVDDDIDFSDDDDLMTMFLPGKENKDSSNYKGESSCNDSNHCVLKLNLSTCSNDVSLRQSNDKQLSPSVAASVGPKGIHAEIPKNQPKKESKFKFHSSSLSKKPPVPLVETTNKNDAKGNATMFVLEKSVSSSIFENFLVDDDDDDDIMSQIEFDNNIFSTKEVNSAASKFDSKSSFNNVDCTNTFRNSFCKTLSNSDKIDSLYSPLTLEKASEPLHSGDTSTLSTSSSKISLKSKSKKIANTQDSLESSCTARWTASDSNNLSGSMLKSKKTLLHNSSIQADSSSDEACETYRNIKTSMLENSTRMSTTPKRTIVQNQEKPMFGMSREPTPKRKFPGPAGALPKLKNTEQLNMLKSPVIHKERRSLTPLTPKTPVEPMINFTQEDDLLSSSAWQELLSYAKRNYPRSAVDKLNSVLASAKSGKLVNGKVSLICAVIKSFVINGLGGRVLLKDNSGQISGALHQNVLEEFEPYLKPGTGIILKDVSVFSPSSKKHYLNITPSNIIQLFPGELNESLILTQTQSSPQVTKTDVLLNEKITRSNTGEVDNVIMKMKCNDGKDAGKETLLDDMPEQINDFFSDDIDINW